MERYERGLIFGYMEGIINFYNFSISNYYELDYIRDN